MQQAAIREFLRNIELFKTLDGNELDAIASIVRIQNFKQNDILFAENSPRLGLLIILKDEVELFKKSV